MRYNKKSSVFYDYINAMKREAELQSRYYKQIGMTRNKIKRLEREVSNNPSEPRMKRIIKLMDYYNNDINNYSTELEYSKSRQKFFEQKLCNHDFGLITSEYTDEYGKKFQSGICLECEAELNELEAPIFTHSIVLSKVVSSMSYPDYKKKLEEYKRISDYSNSGYDFDIGEKIVNEIVKDAKTYKKSR